MWEATIRLPKLFLNFTEPCPAVQVVVVEKPHDLKPLDKATAQSVDALAHNPGFLYLLARLKAQRSLLQSTLYRQRQKDMTEVEFLKSGIAWCSWLETQLEFATKLASTPEPEPAREEEMDAFNAIKAQLETIGEDNE